MAETPVTVTPKPVLTSKTLWVILGAVGAAVIGSREIVDWLGAVLGLQASTALIGLIALVLRAFTNAPVSGTPGHTKAEAGKS